jgi:hypothetical protein
MGEIMTKMAFRALALAAAIVTATFGAFAVPTPASAHWSCGRGAPGDEDTSGRHAIVSSSDVARVGTSTRCAISVNGGLQAYWLDYHCYAIDINGIDTWTYVVAVGATSKHGWVNDDDLADYGSTVRCRGDIT